MRLTNDNVFRLSALLPHPANTMQRALAAASFRVVLAAAFVVLAAFPSLRGPTDYPILGLNFALTAGSGFLAVVCASTAERALAGEPPSNKAAGARAMNVAFQHGTFLAAIGSILLSLFADP